MPLKSGSSQKTISSNISELHSGKTYAKTLATHGAETANKQAVAIALDKARGRAAGGPVGLADALESVSGVAGGFASGGALALLPKLSGPRPTKAKVTVGTLLSAVPGRTDHHATHVPSGSYVIPADIVSGRGQGNTIAGAKTLEKLFKMGPYGTKSLPIKHRAAGGEVESAGEPVRVNLAGGEIVVPPENLMAAVHPDLKTAHEIMDKWVVNERKKLRKTLAKLPGPAKGHE